MRKIIIVSLINIFLAFAAIAQEISLPDNSSGSSMVNKNGMAILPEAGDIALGFDAAPYLNYLGNTFNGENFNSINVFSQNIYGRYYLASDVAVRFNLMVNNSTDVTKHFVQDDAAVILDPLSQKKVIDKRTIKSTDWMLDVGIQKFRGYGRLRGFYGGMLGYGQGRDMTEFQYGNEMNAANSAPTTINFSSVTPINPTVRRLNDDSGIIRNIHVGGIFGVEFFFAPKMCIGAEANIVYDIQIRTEEDFTEQELINGSVAETDTEVDPGTLDRNLDSFHPGVYGGLYFMFHF